MSIAIDLFGGSINHAKATVIFVFQMDSVEDEILQTPLHSSRFRTQPNHVSMRQIQLE